MFGWGKDTDVSQLLAKKDYDRAIEILAAELVKTPRDRRLRLLYADTLCAMGRRREGIEALSDLADELALQGQAAQAIAVLKRIRAMRPNYPEVEEKLAYLLNPSAKPPEAWAFARQQTIAATVAAAEEAHVEPPPDPRQEPHAIEEPAVPPPQVGPAQVASTSLLFSDFRPDELADVIRGVSLVTCGPGDIIVAEGDPGTSLFVVTSGSVRAFIRAKDGKIVPVRELGEGDFFGEVSLLTGKKRSATVTATSRCELLELSKDRVDKIAASHPRILEVLQQFYDQRAGSTIEAEIRGLKAKRKKAAVKIRKKKDADKKADKASEPPTAS